MSRVCELTGKGRQVGNNVSHANNKTKRTFLPNLQNVTLISDALGQSVKLRVSTHGLRSVEHVGGLDNWLLKTSDDKLSPKVRKLKREIAKKAGGGKRRGLRAASRLFPSALQVAASASRRLGSQLSSVISQSGRVLPRQVISAASVLARLSRCGSTPRRRDRPQEERPSERRQLQARPGALRKPNRTVACGQ